MRDTYFFTSVNSYGEIRKKVVDFCQIFIDKSFCLCLNDTNPHSKDIDGKLVLSSKLLAESRRLVRAGAVWRGDLVPELVL